MAALSIFTVVISFCVHATVDCRSLLQTDGEEDTFQPLCSRKCNNPPEVSDNGTDFKYPCSCSKSCAVFGDCCYDSPYKNTESGKQFDFISLSVVGRGAYQAVSSCPPHKRSDFCKKSLGHQWPVTSRVTNITYGNIFCASCNGDDENLISWNVELRCSPQTGTAGSPASKLIYRSDEFWKINERDQTKMLCKFHVHSNDFSIVDGLELRPFTNTKKISACSASWRDLTVEEKCKSYEDPIYLQNAAFKNSHCALCNHQNLEGSQCIPSYVRKMLLINSGDPSIDAFCKDQGSKDCTNTPRGKGRSHSPKKLTYIFEKECLAPKGKKCCPEHQKFDRRRGICSDVIKG